MNTENEKQNAERFSAYLDDALNVDEVNLLLNDTESVEQSDRHFSTAARYHMVGDALRGELSEASMVDVSAQIHRAIQHESFDAVEAVQVAKPPKRTENRFDFFAWLESFSRPLAGMAVAASVAMLMVVTVVQTQSSETGQQLASSPASLPATILTVAQQPDDELLDKEQQAAEFDIYLTEHAEFAAQDTLQGRIPYVRAVSYQAE